jgi:TetR/AcrR family transcriptional repressor of nem operon
VPRTKEFRPEEAPEKAMHLFWVKGYGATSMRDLLEGMGIGRSSFYATFGDKRALFLAAFDRFEGERTSWVDEALAASGLDGVEKVFRRTLGGFVAFEPRRGRLLAYTAVELAPPTTRRWPRGSRATSGVWRRPSRGPWPALGRGGEIPVAAGGDPKALARFLVSTLHVQAADDRRRSGADAAG